MSDAFQLSPKIVRKCTDRSYARSVSVQIRGACRRSPSLAVGPVYWLRGSTYLSLSVEGVCMYQKQDWANVGVINRDEGRRGRPNMPRSEPPSGWHDAKHQTGLCHHLCMLIDCVWGQLKRPGHVDLAERPLDRRVVRPAKHSDGQGFFRDLERLV